MRTTVVVPLLLGLFLPLLPAEAGNATGRAVVLPPVTGERAAKLSPVTRNRATDLRPVRILPIATGSLDAKSPVRGTSPLKPVTRDRAAGLKPVTVDRAAGLEPVNVGRAAERKPIATDRAAKTKGLTVEGPGLLPISDGRAAGLKEIAEGGLRPVTLDRAAVPGMVIARGRTVENDLLRGSDLPVFAWNDGYLLPYEARSLVRKGYFSEDLYRTVCSTRGYSRFASRLDRAFHRYGWGRANLRVGRGSGYWAMNRLDSCGPQWYYRASYLRRGCLPGRFVGDFYFPLGYYLRPIRHGSLAYNKTWWPILVPWDCAETVPEDFDRTLRKSHFPMVIGDIAFKDGNYVQAALAFRDALDRNEAATPAGAFAFADALIALRNYQYAEKSLRAGLTMAPTWADKLDRNGVYGKNDDLAKHLSDVEQFTKDYPKVASGWFLLGYLRMTSGDIGLREKALPAFEEFLDLVPDDALGRRYVDLLKGERREIRLEIGIDDPKEPDVAKNR
jgi:tetratricopeptide (TPR) repeat protein